MAKFLDSTGLDHLIDLIKTALDGKAASSHSHSADNITSGTLPIARGGTGATTADAARTALGAAASGHDHDAADIVSGTLPIARGGTGATSASEALSALGAAASSHTHSTSQVSGLDSTIADINRDIQGLRNAMNNDPKIVYGVATDIGGTANTTVYRHVGLTGFASTPSVFAIAQSTTPNNCSVSVSNVTTSGFDIRLYRTNTADTDVFWIAVGQQA